MNFELLKLLAGLLPGEDPVGIEEEREEDEKEVKSKDESEITQVGGDTHGKEVVEVGGEILEKLLTAGETRSEENSGQRVIEVDTSDEELERGEGQGGVEDVGEHQSDVGEDPAHVVGEHQAAVKDKRFRLRDSQPSPRREVVVEVESDDEEPILEDMDSMGTGVSNILFNKFT